MRYNYRFTHGRHRGGLLLWGVIDTPSLEIMESCEPQYLVDLGPLGLLKTSTPLFSQTINVRKNVSMLFPKERGHGLIEGHSPKLDEAHGEQCEAVSESCRRRAPNDAPTEHRHLC